jgi:hypothetical protein
MSSLFALGLEVNIERYSFYANYITFVFGFIGNILNILVFGKLKLFRNNRSAFYLIVESIADILILCINVLPEIFQLIHGTDPANISVIWCKAKTSSGQTCRLLVASTVCFEALDQFLSTNHQYYLRQLTTLKLARYLLFVSTILWFLQTIPYIIFNNIVPPSGCIINNKRLTNYYSFFYYICLTSLIPIITSSVFSLLAYRNVRHLVRRQIPIERRRLDRQMTAMIFVRVIAFVILLLPYTIFRIYIVNVNATTENALQNTINQLISEITTFLFFWVYSVRLFAFVFV